MGRGDIIKRNYLEIFNTKEGVQDERVSCVSLDHQEVPATSWINGIVLICSIGHHFNLSIRF